MTNPLVYQLKSTPKIMGILNVTPDSFSDGGKFYKFNDAIAHFELLAENGADIIDIGGESTRPGAEVINEDEELKRVIPIVKHIAKNSNILISIDTSNPEVMRQAIANGAHIINDIRALKTPGSMQVIAETKVPVCLMHMQGEPKNMQDNPHYDNIIDEIKYFLKQRINACYDAGIAKEQIIIDPGFGFGKTVDDNYNILANLDSFKEFDMPILVGLSRKSMLGNLLQKTSDNVLGGSLCGAILSAQKGANIIRVHDVLETCDAIKILTKVQSQRNF